jgi:FkbM family methyltransferase
VKKIKIAFIKKDGLSSGGTERWMQIMAANLDKKFFQVDYYYSDIKNNLNQKYTEKDQEYYRYLYLKKKNVNLIKFNIGSINKKTLTYDWIDTNFWDLFDEKKYDLVQCASAGPKEYPFYKINLPIIKFLALNAGFDYSSNIKFNIHISQWQRSQWLKRKIVNKNKFIKNSDVVYVPVEPPKTNINLRKILGISNKAIIAGFHQRNSNEIFSHIPLRVFKKLENNNIFFLIMGGGEKYRQQAKNLKIKNIRFLDHSSDSFKISQFLNTLDIYAHGRKDGETFGTVLAEAMIHKKPCISHYSSISNAQPETIGPGGFFCYNEKKYFTYLQKLFLNSNLRKKLSIKAELHAKENYLVKKNVNKLSNIYNKILNKKNYNILPETIPYGCTKMGFLYSGNINQSSEIAYNVLTQGIPEEFSLAITKYFLPKVKNFVDIGAYTGLYCYVAAKEGRSDIKIYAYEPQKKLYKHINKTIFINNWEKKIFFYPIGIGQKKSRGKLYIDGTGSTLNKSFNSAEHSNNIVIDSLDNQKKTLKIEKIDFIKIDVENFELEVLKGSKKILAQDRPYILIEIIGKMKERNFENNYYHQTIRLLHSYNYNIFLINSNYSINKVNSFKDEKIPNHVNNYICVPVEINCSNFFLWCQKFKANQFRQHKGKVINKLKFMCLLPFWIFSKCFLRIKSFFFKFLYR